MANVYVFRVVTDDAVKNGYIQEEFRAGRLRQGWGGHTADLTAPREDWIARQCAGDVFEDNEAYYTAKYRSLRIMLEIREGDILIIPKMPQYTQFTLCRAAGGYRFMEPAGYEGDDFWHVIPIDAAGVRVFSYHGGEDCENIRAKMRAYQSPVNNVWNENIRSIAAALLSGESNTEVTPMETIVNSITADIYQNRTLLQRFRNLGNRPIEEIVKLIFEKLGYEFVRSNSYDRLGGDADLIFVNNALSEFFEAGVNGAEVSGEIYVQVKNKDGTDSRDADGVRQLVQRTENIPGAVKILISTTDEFTGECKRLAKQNNVLLIDGFGFLKLVVKYINA